jgi:dienelactone hydrolase
MPQKTPLNPILHSRREHEGYSVENLAFESVPGFFVTGLLYRPVGASEGVPAMLCPHGHFEEGIARADHQARCARLARMGASVLAYDMLGYRESTQADHRSPHALTIQLWNSIRCVDFLLEVCGADPERIGVTGASGGGTQSFLLSAVDERVKLSAPVVMVSAHFFGGCVCESGKPIHRDPPTNNAEIAAIAAPRPQLLISCGADWTKNCRRVEAPYIRKVYSLFDGEDAFEHVHFPLGEHDYGHAKRVVVYEFIARHFRLERDAALERGGAAVSERVSVEPPEALRVWTEEHPRPAAALAGGEAVFRALRGG